MTLNLLSIKIDFLYKDFYFTLAEIETHDNVSCLFEIGYINNTFIFDILYFKYIQSFIEKILDK